ncbi:LPXTG-motif cell wall-anchored protein [Enterococcus sp. PF1-24]|uniref:LPXTG cell wall anchor domain-containing protein n=1 Tax=unclassified Enterococcus TaxID=2608891 RepID=UPI002475A9B5|nr:MULTISPECIES: LPXTG cell wall anchor domain-containing protein [unclassified Enterococcus]MDH6363795.1 LPXTG-motif cell wall-anchored protein [Enterococcus sp. PFB1-1]MDH6400751.1 LPXTG-motif cell wall-anchored protein [Enterococcus sp. PF1-24]
MQIKKILTIVFSILLGSSALYAPTVVQAADEMLGGEVTTKGKITFYEETANSDSGDSSSTSQGPSDSASNSQQPSSNGKTPPTGKLPNTGEAHANRFLVSSGLLLILLAGFLFKKKVGQLDEK